jgi:hypothetical protein
MKARANNVERIIARNEKGNQKKSWCPWIVACGFRAIPFVEVQDAPMAKKTEMSDSSLWITAIVLLALAAWTYFKT